MKIFSILFLFLTFNCAAQDSMRKNSVCIELGGTGLTYSLGYERTLLTRPFISHAVKIAISYPFINGVDQFFVPLEYKCYFGQRKLRLMAGGGIILLVAASPFPTSIKSQRDYAALYKQSPYLAVDKYGLDSYRRSFDIAYTAHLGFKSVGRKIDFWGYLNCFLIRFSWNYHFQPIWPAIGFSIKF